ncbi:hypothetical protein [Methanosarcina sp.]|nr:hypothetical protein [Methanosarcina sp.]MDW5551195.1 hypothetical protein [Methanosarcina sp.]MDW5555039.1 hypothetical protein [Methanosarcina sp.]MDW5560756.1 hypothetical protein [Methanosarcina sp.]
MMAKIHQVTRLYGQAFENNINQTIEDKPQGQTEICLAHESSLSVR